MNTSDQGLIARIRARDEGALADLYDRYADLLLALAFRILRDRSEAEDVTLEVLERVWREADRYDPARGSVRSWLSVMVRSRALDLVRARSRHERAAARAARAAGGAGAAHEPATPTGEGMMSHHAPDASEQDEDRRLVRAALQDLSELQREAIELAYYEGLTQTEIARRLNAPLGTVKTRIRDGMQKLRTTLQPLYSGPEA